ncbi:phage integrase SAM-like domain-containing protein [bacterium]|nr:phage integrase SAM-like domain-containing protein [bacterium]
MAYLQKLNGGKKRQWRAFIKIKGYPSQSKTFRLKAEASVWAKETEESILSGNHLIPSKSTVSDLIEKYKEDILSYRKNNGGCQVYLLKWWDEKLGKMKVKDITHPILENLRTNLRKSENKYGNIHKSSNVNRYFTLISAVFRTATEWGWIQDNPASKIKKFKNSFSFQGSMHPTLTKL